VTLLDMIFPFTLCAEKKLWCRTVFGDAGVRAQILNDMPPA
jgi:hypothetical protein